ncbi:response regulator transcription factor [Chryseobacterium indoltheticum]|nr:response regulator transcription factor [Chryseobacterium indoltheticum]
MLRIAIADDHTLFRRSLALLIGTFEQMKVVIEAGNGIELIKKLDLTEVEILLLDLQMPELNGFEACKKIKELYPDIKILILTQMNETETIKKAIALGVNGYFTKNTPPKELKDAIWKLQDDGFYFENSLTSVIKEILDNQSFKFDTYKEVKFTTRELEIIKFTVKGLKAREIAQKLFISTKTVNSHKQNIQQKYGFETMMSAILYCIYHKIIDLNCLEENI